MTDGQRATGVDPLHPPRLFAHSTDAWIHLALPADNPNADPHIAVVVNRLSVKPDDPVLTHLQRAWPPPIAIGPEIGAGFQVFQLFRRMQPADSGTVSVE